jgi:diguanylate cyclase (GGDEF)-like protein
MLNAKQMRAGRTLLVTAGVRPPAQADNPTPEVVMSIPGSTAAVDPPLAGPEALLALTQAAVRRGDHHEGARLAEAALRALNDDDGARRALALRLLALNRWRIGDTEAAARAADDALALYQALADPQGEVETLSVLCMVYNDLGLHREALELAVRALRLSRAVQDRRLECWSLNRLGASYECLDDPRLALQYVQQSLDLARELPRNDEELFAALNNLAGSELKVARQQMRQGDFDAAEAMLSAARTHAEEALALARRSGNTHRETLALGNLAKAAGHGPNRLHAQSLLEQYQALARRHGYHRQALAADFDMADLLRHDGRHSLAALRLEQLLTDIDADDGALRLAIEHALYDSYKALGRYEQALLHLERHASLERAQLRQQAEAQARVLLARLEIDQARIETASARIDAELQRLRTRELEAEQNALRAHAEALGRAAREDALTGLHNRRAIDEAMPRLIDRSRDGHGPLAVAMADLDHFKQISDRYGHGVGDEVLTRLAQLLRNNTRGADLLARVGGEEFIIVFSGTPIELAHDVCERLRQAVAQHPWREVVPGLEVTVSVGLVAGAPGDAQPVLIARADAALYEAKRRGRNRVHRG